MSVCGVDLCKTLHSRMGDKAFGRMGGVHCAVHACMHACMHAWLAAGGWPGHVLLVAGVLWWGRCQGCVSTRRVHGYMQAVSVCGVDLCKLCSVMGDKGVWVHGPYAVHVWGCPGPIAGGSFVALLM